MVGTPIPDVVCSVVVGVCTVVAGAVPVMVVMPVSVPTATAAEDAETALAENRPPAARAAEYAEAEEERVVAADIALAPDDAVPAAARRAEEEA